MALQFKKQGRKSKRIGLSGKGGCGKSSAITNMYNKPLIFDLEQKWLDQPPFNKFPVMDIGPCTYDSLMSALISVKQEKDLAQYDAIVIDSLSSLEMMCTEHSIGKDYRGDAFAYANFSSGDLNTLPKYFNNVLNILQDIQNRPGVNIDIVLICHAKTGTENNPMGDDYAKIAIDLKKKPMAMVLKWLEYLGCIYDETSMASSKSKSITEGVKVKSSKRMISFDNSSPFFDAKCIVNPLIENPLVETEFDIKGTWVNKILNKGDK